MDPKNFLEAIITNDSEEATQTFVDLMNSKLSDALEVKKVEIASGLFLPSLSMKEEAEQVDEKYMGFEKVKAAVAAKGASNPAALAAYIGRKKYGKKKFQAMAVAGKKK
jgi:hypothetical protein